MARVVVITADAVYQGDVELTAPGGQPVRFLDALRTPQRIGQGAIGASPGLVLERVERTPRGGGEALSFPQAVTLRPGSILAAYDLGEAQSAPKTSYEQRSPELSRVRLCLEGRLVLEGTLSGGTRSLDAVRGQTFVACTDVELIASPRRRLPFLAVNTVRIESFAVLEDGVEAPDTAD